MNRVQGISLAQEANIDRKPMAARFFRWVCRLCAGKSQKYRVAADVVAPVPMQNNWVQVAQAGDERIAELQKQLDEAQGRLTQAQLRLEYAERNRYHDLKQATQQLIKTIEEQIDDLYRDIRLA